MYLWPQSMALVPFYLSTGNGCGDLYFATVWVYSKSGRALSSIKKLTKDTMQALAKKLIEVQRELGAVKKDKQNPFFSSNYADINKFIEVVKPVLNKHGVILLQPLCELNGVPAINTVLVDSDSGEMWESRMPMVFKDNDPQKVGSAITYYRRYALQSCLFLEAEDDDGNKASGKSPSKVANHITNNDMPF